MARTLLLIRHAKAERDGPSDAARALAPRGVRDAQAAGRWLVGHDLVPTHVVVSPARRALQTWEAVSSELGGAPSMTIDDRVYDNTSESLLAVVRDSAADLDTIAIVGHNPSIQALAVALDDGLGDDRARADLFAAYPTTGIAVLDLESTWDELAPGGATLRDFVTPRS
jgi:phosphohistidine phosphatase